MDRQELLGQFVKSNGFDPWLKPPTVGPGVDDQGPTGTKIGSNRVESAGHARRRAELDLDDPAILAGQVQDEVDLGPA